MTTPIPTCRGFTNPAIVLVRNSLLQTSVQQSLGCTTTTATRTAQLQWRSRRNLTMGRSLGAAAAQPSNKGKNKVAPTPRAPKSAPSPSPSPPATPVAHASPPSPKPITRPTPKPTTTATRFTPAAAAATLQKSRHLEPGSIGYARSLAQKSTPTTLYEAAPQRMFLVSSYTAGLFTVLSGGVNVWFNVYNVPEGTHYLIPWAFGAVGAVMAAFGTRFAMTPSGIIRSISVLPANPAAGAGAGAGAGSTAAATGATATAAAAAKAKVSTTTTGTTTGTTTTTPSAAPAAPVLLEIRARRTTPFPFLPLKRIIVEPHQVVMKARLYNKHPAGGPLSAHAQAKSAAEERRRREAARQYERDHLMTAPFRHGAWAAGTVLAGIRRGLTGEGFAPVEVGRTKYKLDITGGYALEDGRALDRIVRVEENPKFAAARFS